MNLSIRFSSRSVRGFSLIEVLIAVLVLATGMLALAALQASVPRNSVDAKVRSQGLAAAVAVLDSVRARASASNDNYESLGTGTSSWSAWSPPAFGTTLTAAASFESRTAVTRFVRDSTAAGCGSASNVPCFRVAGAGDSYRLNDTAEFKRVTVDVRWTDGSGNVRQASVSDVVTSVTRDKTASVMNQTPTPPSGGGEPVARIPRPSEAGIIPIAVGDGRETAASNPKPITGRERGRTDETSFQVFTYANEANNVARLTRVIDTRVLGCRCELGAQPTGGNAYFALPKQPTYWNGKDYVEPADGVSGLRGRTVANAVQNQDLCVTCCLDHHDFAGQATKFDPFRAETLHKHYRDTNEANFLPEFVESNTAGDRYLEACRFIRVNGVFRVATDARLELMNMLETDATVTNASVPLASKVPRYQEAVKSFVNQRVVSSVQNPDLSSFSDILVDPTQMSLQNTGSRRFLHNRGLYIDYLEADAREAIAKAITDCPAASSTVDCVLPYLPFVSINTTDIAQWDSDPLVSNISVTNLGTNTPHPTPNGNQAELPTFARGITTGLANGTENANVFMQRSNTGLSDSKPIDWLDAGVAIADPHATVTGEVSTDRQSFRVGNSSGGGASCPNGTYSVNVVPPANIALGNFGLSWGNPLALPNGCTSAEAGGTCSAPVLSGGTYSADCPIRYTLPQQSLLAISNYNRSFVSSTSTNWSCGNKSGTFQQNMCTNLRVTSVTAGLLGTSPYTGVTVSSPTNDGRLGELTNIDISLLQPSTMVTVTLGADSNSPIAMGYTCNGNKLVVTPCPN